MKARAQHTKQLQKIIVILPTNALQAQQVQSAKKCFKNTTVKVLDAADYATNMLQIPSNFNVILFMSIHHFASVSSPLRDLFTQFINKVDTVFVDEYHSFFSEGFRAPTWEALKQLPLLRSKLVFLSATAPDFMKRSFSKSLLIANTKQFGDKDASTVPMINICVKESTRKDLASKNLISDVCNYVSMTSFGSVHIICRVKSLAAGFNSALSSKNVISASLTSDTSPNDKKKIIQNWRRGALKVLVSTIKDGIDCSFCSRMYLFDGAWSVADTIQCIGRIRPSMQKGLKAKVIIFLVASHSRTDDAQ